MLNVPSNYSVESAYLSKIVLPAIGQTTTLTNLDIDSNSVASSSSLVSASSTLTSATTGISASGTGLLAEYYEGLDLVNLRQTQIDPTINFNWWQNAPMSSLPSDYFSVRWSGEIQPQYSETYTFYTHTDDGVRLWVNDQLLIDQWVNQAPTELAGTINLMGGQRYDIRLEYYDNGGGALAQLLWSSPSQVKEIVPQAVLFASTPGSNADAVVNEQARSAYSFIDSIGFNTHLRYYDTAYGNYPLIRQRLLELGVRHIRDGGSDPTWIQRTNELGTLGIRSTIVIDPFIGTGPNASYDLRPPGYDVYTLVKNLVPAGVEAVEILNEFDLTRIFNGYSRNGQPVTDANWIEYLRDFTRDTYNAINSDPATENIGVIGPSFVYQDSSVRVGNLSQWVDYGNAHPYSYPAHPGNGNLQQDLAIRAIPFGDRPMIATENGFPTGSPLSFRPVSETVQSKYIPRMFLESFNSGVYRTFSYEFIDQLPNPDDSEYNFGIVRFDGTPKPAYAALQYMIGLLNDSSAAFRPESLDYSFSGDTQNVRHTLLQKSNGNFYLVLWLEVPSTDQVSSQTVTLNLNTPIDQAKTYLPNFSVQPFGQYQAPTRLTLTVPDLPLIVELVPR